MSATDESESSPRRSSRIKSKRAKKVEEEEQNSVSAEEQESESNANDANNKEVNYKSKLRDRKQSNGSVQEQDMANLEGDLDYKYTEGECVWAKYQDYPWWPGQTVNISKRERARSKRASLSVKWFGDFPVKTYVHSLR